MKALGKYIPMVLFSVITVPANEPEGVITQMKALDAYILMVSCVITEESSFFCNSSI